MNDTTTIYRRSHAAGVVMRPQVEHPTLVIGIGVTPREAISNLMEARARAAFGPFHESIDDDLLESFRL